MTIKELEYVSKILLKIKDPDQHVAKAIAYVNKDLAAYDARKGQMKDSYESHPFDY